MVEYQRGSYDKSDEKEQWIRLSDGCPNGCKFCYAPRDLQFYGIPKILRNDVKIMDMNLLQQPNALAVIRYFGSRKVNKKVVYYELVCGIDWRILTQETADELHKNRFVRIRIAWDYGLSHQYKIKDAINMLVKAGYKPRKLTIFMICNWETTYVENLKKLDLCKVWNVKVADCWYDNQLSPNIKPIHWTEEQIRKFRSRVRKHNQLVLFGIDPEFISPPTSKKVGFLEAE